jgi:predicted ribosomally synthesized peptide with SipW-like signal peptide
MKLKTVAMTGMMSLAGLGLIGVGAHAAFTTSTTSSQQITAGSLSVVLTSPEASAGDGTTSLTLAPYTANSSSFVTGDETVTATNNGSVNATELNLSLSSTYPMSALASELSVCISSTGIGTGGSEFTIYNGLLSGVNPASWWQNGDVLTVSGTPPTATSAPTDNWNVQIYAGPGQSTACGTSAPSTPDLGNDAMGQSIAISATMTYQG